MKNFLVITFLLLCLHLVAQRTPIDPLVVISSELNVREKPNTNSRIVITLSNGEVVYPDTTRLNDPDDYYYDNCDTINGLYGCWQKINYQGHTGFVFSPYLGTKYMFYYQDYPIHYLPKVQYWYGVYIDTVSGLEVIRLIQPILKEPHPGDEQDHKILGTNQDQQSLFIIATNEFISEKAMGLFTRYNRVGFKCSESLLPGDMDAIYFSSKDNRVTSPVYYLFTSGSFKRTSYGLVLSDHEIVLSNNLHPDPNNSIVQNITDYLGWKEGYVLKYFGDIDGDGKPDFAIEGSSNSGGGITFFLSSIAKEGELVRPAGGIWFVDEC